MLTVMAVDDEIATHSSDGYRLAIGGLTVSGPNSPLSDWPRCDSGLHRSNFSVVGVLGRPGQGCSSVCGWVDLNDGWRYHRADVKRSPEVVCDRAGYRRRGLLREVAVDRVGRVA